MRRRERDAVVRSAVRLVGAMRPSEERLLRRLAQFADIDGTIKHATPTSKLTQLLRLGQSTVERARRTLVAQGLLALEGGGTGRDSYRYRLVLEPALAADLADRRRYPQKAVWGRKTQGLTRFYKEPRARRESSTNPRNFPIPPPAARESFCRRHRDGPGASCRACGTSPRARRANARALRTNPRAGYVTPTPPRAALHDEPVGTSPPPGLLDDVRAQLALLANRRPA